MNYDGIPNYQFLLNQIVEYSKLKIEYGSQDIIEQMKECYQNLESSLNTIKSLSINKELYEKEPDDLNKILSLRPQGPRKLWNNFREEEYLEKVEGALLARMAGCILGANVESWSIEEMESWAKYSGDAFPPINYWSRTRNPGVIRYSKCDYTEYTKDNIKYVPVDDDIAYTLLGLLIAEEYGLDFTTEDVGKAWEKYLSYAYTAELVTLNNLRKGLEINIAAEVDNPYCQWIGGDIRSDPWAYIAPGLPEKAAQMAYRDAYLSHRRNGIFGAMFFSAAQSAAFSLEEPLEAIKIGLTEIPEQCNLAKAIRWSLNECKNIKNYKDARAAVDDKFKGMSPVHTINNACLVVFGLSIGGTDVTKVLSETVAMGLDNDCTAATAGSIVGAIVGKKGVPSYWYKNFNGIIKSYLNGSEEFRIEDVVDRFKRLAQKAYDL